MKLCVGTSNGIVILDPDRGGVPLMVLAEPSPVWCMARDSRDPNLLYAGIHGLGQLGTSTPPVTALARSTDGGRNWSDITPRGAREEGVWAVATPPDRSGEVYVGTSHARLFRSENAGQRFVECAAFRELPGRDRWSFPPPPHIPHVRSISFDPANPSVVYIGVEEGGVIRSRDRGRTFELLNNGIYTDVHTIVVDPSDSRRLWATTGRGFYLSEDAGGSWRQVTEGLSRPYVVPLAASRDGAVLYTAGAAGPPPTWTTGNGGASALMFRSLDRGNSFEPVAALEGPMRAMVMRMAAAEGGEFFAVATDGTVLRSRGRGENVEPVASKLPPAYDLVAMP